LRYFSNDFAVHNSGNLNTSTNSLTSSLSSFASAIIGSTGGGGGGGNDVNKSHYKYQQLRRHSSQQNEIDWDDIDLLRSILANVTSANFLQIDNVNDKEIESNSSAPLTSSSNSANSGNHPVHFDDSDLNIVVFILKSLKIKQIYLYNLALLKKKLKQVKKLIKNLNTANTTSEISTESATILSSPQSDTSQNSYLLNEQKKLLTAQINSNVQVPLCVEYEDLTLFHAKK
jgi:hypothetical protein